MTTNKSWKCDELPDELIVQVPEAIYKKIADLFNNVY